MTAAATSDVLTLPDGLHQLDLRGAFAHPHWLAFLCGGLSARGVSVVSGRAVRHGPLQWEGQFTVAGPVEGLDALALAGTRPVSRDAAVPVLTSFAVSRRTDSKLELQVQAPDALGFLGRLLSRISLLTLLPSELEIATVGGAISDRIVLGGIGSAAPDDEVLGALEEMLTSMRSSS